MRLDQVPGVKASPITGFVTFGVKSKRHPEQDARFQHPGYVEIWNFMRAAYWVGKEAKIKVSDNTIEILDGRDFYVVKFD